MPRCWRESRRRRCRGGSCSARVRERRPAAAGARQGSCLRPPRDSGRVTPAPTASTFTPGSSCRAVITRASSGPVATRCVPPVPQDRICLTSTGQVLLELRHRSGGWDDASPPHRAQSARRGPRPAVRTDRAAGAAGGAHAAARINLILYYGVLGAHAAWRSRLGGPVTVEPSRSTAAPSVDREAAARAARPPERFARRRAASTCWPARGAEAGSG
jgi:hypothetical protein